MVINQQNLRTLLNCKKYQIVYDQNNAQGSYLMLDRIKVLIRNKGKETQYYVATELL